MKTQGKERKKKREGEGKKERNPRQGLVSKAMACWKTRRPPREITWAPRGNHVGPHGQSRGPPGEITWALMGNHVGPLGKSRGHPGEITWAPRVNHVGPPWKSRGPPRALTWAPMGNHVGPQGNSMHCVVHAVAKSRTCLSDFPFRLHVRRAFPSLMPRHPGQTELRTNAC